MKKMICVFSLFVFVLSACLPNPGSQAAAPTATVYVQPTYTQLPTLTPYPTQPAPTTATPIVPTLEPTLTPTITFTPNNGSTPQPIANCDKHGTVAWQNDNQTSGETYGLAPVGGLSESCWVVAQTHWKESDDGHMIEVRAVFAVAPHMVAWLKGYLGGTGWYFGGSESDVRANLAQQAAELEERDGKMKTYFIVLPKDADAFPILDHVQTK